MSKSADVEELVNETIKIYQRLDCAFNNAGISESEEEAIGTVSCREEEWDRFPKS